MELFRNVDIDWMRLTKYFVGLSLALLAIGWISVFKDGGLRYGIDFRGGTLVYVRFAGQPPIQKIRQGLALRGSQTAPFSRSAISPIRHHETMW